MLSVSYMLTLVNSESPEDLSRDQPPQSKALRERPKGRVSMALVEVLSRLKMTRCQSPIVDLSRRISK